MHVIQCAVPASDGRGMGLDAGYARHQIAKIVRLECYDSKEL